MTSSFNIERQATPTRDALLVVSNKSWRHKFALILAATAGALCASLATVAAVRLLRPMDLRNFRKGLFANSGAKTFSSFARNCNCSQGECLDGEPLGSVGDMEPTIVEAGGPAVFVSLPAYLRVNSTTAKARIDGTMGNYGRLGISPSEFDACAPAWIRFSKMKPIGEMQWPGFKCPMEAGAITLDSTDKPLAMASQVYSVPLGFGWLATTSVMTVSIMGGPDEQPLFCLKIITTPQ